MGFKEHLSRFKKSSRGNFEPGEKTKKYHSKGECIVSLKHISFYQSKMYILILDAKMSQRSVLQYYAVYLDGVANSINMST